MRRECESPAFRPNTVLVPFHGASKPLAIFHSRHIGSRGSISTRCKYCVIGKPCYLLIHTLEAGCHGEKTVQPL